MTGDDHVVRQFLPAQRTHTRVRLRIAGRDAYDDELRGWTVLPDERGIGGAVEARVEHQNLAVTANVDDAEQALKQRGADFALIGDEGKLVGFDAVAGGLDPGDESPIRGPGASDGIGIEQPLERGRSRAANAGELLKIRFNIETDAGPAQSRIGGPLLKFSEPHLGLGGVRGVEIIALLAGQRQPCRDRNAGGIQLADDLRAAGAEVDQRKA